MATFIDTRYKTFILDDLLTATRHEIVTAVRKTFQEPCDNETDPESSQLSPTKEPSSKRCRVDPLMALLEEMEKMGRVGTEPRCQESISGRLAMAVDEYAIVSHDTSPNANPLQYWLSKSDNGLFGTLATYVISMLSILVSLAPIERVFSIAGREYNWQKE